MTDEDRCKFFATQFDSGMEGSENCGAKTTERGGGGGGGECEAQMNESEFVLILSKFHLARPDLRKAPGPDGNRADSIVLGSGKVHAC